MITADLHTHSSYSVDCDSAMEAMCEAAIEQGLSAIAFTEHKDFIPELEGCDYFDYKAYCRQIETCRSRFNGKLQILKAIEVDFSSAYLKEAADFVSNHTFDYIIGSVHYLGIEPISENRSTDFFASADREETIRFYFKELQTCVGTGLFHTIGHLDMIKRHSMQAFGVFNAGEWMELISPILKRMITTGTALGLNTSGWRHDPEEQYPSELILQTYKELGGTLAAAGSDAHLPQDVGRDFERLDTIIQTYGFSLLDIRDLS